MSVGQKACERVVKRIRVKPTGERKYTPSVSVVIACYNYARYLRAAVQSCLSQQDVTVEVIIVDDASTDDSLALAESLSREHGNVSLVRHSTNTGPVDAFNDGARMATGEFLVRLDADDMLTPGSLGRATLIAQSFPSVGLVYGHPLHFPEMPLPIPRLQARAWTVWPGLLWLTDRCRSGKNVITSPEVLMRRSLLEEVGYLSPLAHSHDMELWLRLAAFSDVAYIHGADQAWHRDHSESLSARCVDELLDFRERRAAFEVLFSGPAAGRPAASALQRQAYRTLALEALGHARRELARWPDKSARRRIWLELAEATDEEITHSAQWARLHQAPRLESLPAPLRLSSFAFRVRGRIKSELEWLRWHRTGVY
ncbi:Glycosyltransferase family 2 protein [Arthrobacter sp. 9AX]|uniref:glycosyltransferase family 2 protein n=1 Tax=Arthrobacter sp. 9AX TaxID=2653131 RepID=UPI0012F42DD2|nr:glycosyltransferase family A protein [Arthrobacter sp. 9AX]VXA99699.1 Glycosyltransferase family 2 protein [Arthrobacter sp. 9AX]